jgi:hypothetical protein
MQTENKTTLPNKKQSPIAGLEHLSHLGKENIDIEANLVSSTKNVTCKFWLGIYKKGEISPQEILSSSDFDSALDKASSKGLDSTDSILFSDCSDGETNFLLLVPDLDKESSIEMWLENIFSSVNSIAPKSIGIHFGASLMNKEALLEKIYAFISKSIDGEGKFKFNTLYVNTAGHSYQDLLNVIFDIKNRLSNKDLNLKFLH